MSAFLGPIHYWLYNKIKLQESLIENILEASTINNWCQDLRSEVEASFGKTDTRALEEIIDQNNIHGWLQGRISQAESKLAFAVTKIIEKNPEYILELKKIAYNFGVLNKVSENLTAIECYKLLNDTLIDGMPCDRVNEVIESDDDQVVWKQNSCVHSDYWENIGGDISVYYALRYEIIRGMFAKSNLEYIANENKLNIIRRK